MARRPVAVGLLLFLLAGLFLFLGVYIATFLIERGISAQGRIALVRIEGVILDAREKIEELLDYKENPSIKAIVLRIDSPGGAVVPSQEIYEEVRRLREESGKLVVVSMGTVAASGGYYIASASDRIVANPGTLTGSIGVIMELANMTGLLERIGVESIVIKSGEHKDLASPFRRMRPEERKILQGVLDSIHSQFIRAVSEGRGLPVETVRSLADGRVFTGEEAVGLGLVDQLGTLQETIQLAAEMTGIEGKPQVVERRPKFSWVDLLRSWWGRSVGESFNRRIISVQYLMIF